MHGAKSWVWQASIDSDGDDVDDYANQIEVFILLYRQQASSARSVIRLACKPENPLLQFVANEAACLTIDEPEHFLPERASYAKFSKCCACHGGARASLAFALICL